MEPRPVTPVGLAQIPLWMKKVITMARNVTAVYRSFQTADLVRCELEGFGISRSYIHVIPDTERHSGDMAGAAPSATTSADATGVTTSGYGTEDDRYADIIDDLYLPDDDTRTYKHCVRRGDYVVSAEVDDDQVSRVVEIMRHPEAETHNLDERSEAFRTEADLPRRGGWSADETRLGTRDAAHEDPFTRSYQRKDRLEERRYD
jgi:hypothetical protein